MTTIVLERARTLREYQLDIPVAEYGQLLIRVEYGCILDGDLDAFYRGGGKMPRIFGSALVGTVEDDDASTHIIPFRSSAYHAIAAGTRVVAFFDSSHDGSLREYAVVPESQCFSLPSGVPEYRIPMVPDVAIAAGALRRLGVSGGDTLVVLGARAAGVVLSITAQWMGAQVVLVDPSRPRLEQAQELGIQRTISPIAASLPEEIEWHHGGVVNYIVDTSGDPEYMPAAIAAMHEGSVLGLTVPLEYPFSFSQVVEADIGIQSLVDVTPDVDTAAEIAVTTELERLVSLSVPLVEIPAAVPAIMREPGTFLRMVGYTL
jgi:threonine dehydrogenase-like Zn-dependent dehydrogenase